MNTDDRRLWDEYSQVLEGLEEAQTRRTRMSKDLVTLKVYDYRDSGYGMVMVVVEDYAIIGRGATEEDAVTDAMTMYEAYHNSEFRAAYNIEYANMGRI